MEMPLYLTAVCRNCGEPNPLMRLTFNRQGLAATHSTANPIEVACGKCQQTFVYDTSALQIYQATEPIPDFRPHPAFVKEFEV